MSISLLEVLIGLSGILVVPFLSYRNYYVEQIGQLVLTIGFFASFPAGSTLSVIFLCLNLACYLGKDVSTWRTRFAAGIFLAVQAARALLEEAKDGWQNAPSLQEITEEARDPTASQRDRS